jgi:3-deoxy-D-manno-octulosonic-acid transferase
MRLLYDLGIHLYHLGILTASLFNTKAKQWIKGRRGWMRSLASGIDPESDYIWFHCSSLGEFEQGRPVLEKIRGEKPGQKILLTFFSPSGYEIRKNYAGADHICYLPLDTPENARAFLNIIPIKQAYFVKYEFWYHFIRELKERNIPVFLISAIFRKNQFFFRRYGGWYRKMLSSYNRLFVQDAESGDLLSRHGINHFTVSGDTRFDRVYEIAEKVREIPEISKFAGSSPMVIAGSIWPPDEDLLCTYINGTDHAWKFILVPHEIDTAHILKLQHRLKKKTLVYSRLGNSDMNDARVMIIDIIGLLSSLYSYGEIAYIGGGFGKGIHNTLEAATFGMPVIFGPRYRKFREARELVDTGAGYPVQDFESLRSILDRFIDDEKMLKSSGKAARDYVNSKIGATSIILNSTLKS